MNKVIFILDFDTFEDTLFETARYAAKCDVCIWLRIKGKSSRFIYNTAAKLRRTLPRAYLILSERADIAHIASFQGVHLNTDSPSPHDVKLSFPELKVGYSAHSKDEIYAAEADYYTLSPVFYTEKPYTVSPLESVDIMGLNSKVYALGGVHYGNIGKIKKMGFYGAAGISFVNELSDIKKFFNQP